MSNESNISQKAASLNLSSDEILHIASFLVSNDSDKKSNSITKSESNDLDSLKDEEDQPSYSDLEAESEDEGNFDSDDGMAFDDMIESRYDRHYERLARQDAFHQSCNKRFERARKLKSHRYCVTREARDIIAMASVCSAWRRELTCSGDDATDTLLWKALYHKIFCPDMHHLYDDTFLKEKGLNYFLLFQLMIKVRNFSKDNNVKASANEGKIDLKKEDLDDIVVLVDAQYKGKYFTRKYVGIGKMDENQVVKIQCQILEIYVKKKDNIGGKKHLSYVKENQEKNNAKAVIVLLFFSAFASLDERSSDEEHDDYYYEENASDLEWTKSAEKNSSFPSVSIFIVSPSSRNNNAAESTISLKKIYDGKPKWKYEEYQEEFGPEHGCVIAHLFGSCYLDCDRNGLTVGYGGFRGVYTDEQLQEYNEEYNDYESNSDEEDSDEDDCEKDDCKKICMKDLNDKELVELRKDDVMRFVSGSK
eukprot:CAMPEP_0178960166 /NCGR_PEP_ID=MMETSP0789-20121207/12792_1 /TAXON_ID=3005 /ORGANISM="Rhizosolenia setigera, Strain CCMP 1694" /LENGTH=476 /DNA_ID=CAMNT_0020643443 /DNA_START=6 /DNA_END=1438 /DNA_ORIENTATION=+